MKKVSCNVLYGVSMPACCCDMKNVTIDLGLFQEREDAECAGMLTKKILENDDSFEFISVGDFDIQKEYYPDAELTNEKFTTRYNENLNDFVRKNAFTQKFLEKYGFVELSMFVMDCLDECIKDEKPGKSPTQRGE